MKLSLVKIAVFFCLIASGAVGKTFAQQQGYDLSSGGQPTITGALGGSVTGTSDVLQNLSVTINFGEVSAANPNSVVKVIVPIAIRSIQPYEVTVTMTGTGNIDARAIQLSDIGFGVNNLRVLGIKAQICTRSSHVFNSLFNNEPSTTSTLNASGRVAYQSSLTNLTLPTVILTGPKLTQGTSTARRTDDGWVFDAIFVITPQFFNASSSNAILTFKISPGPNVQC